jgi:hypothetical protein
MGEVVRAKGGTGFRGKLGAAADQRWATVEEGGAGRHCGAMPAVEAGGSTLVPRRKKVGKKATRMLGRGLFRLSTGVNWPPGRI